MIACSLVVVWCGGSRHDKKRHSRVGRGGMADYETERKNVAGGGLGGWGNSRRCAKSLGGGGQGIK